MKIILSILLISQLAVADIDLKPDLKTSELPVAVTNCQPVTVNCQCESSSIPAWAWAGIGIIASSAVWGVFWYQRK